MATEIDVHSDGGLNKLDDYFRDHSYASGYELSQSDYTLFNSVSRTPFENCKNVARWYLHVANITDEDLGIIRPKVNESNLHKTVEAPVEEDEDEVDLFGSSDEEEDAEAERIREERLKAYAEKKSKKPGPIARSQILLDCKPWDDETDMEVMTSCVRSVVMDGLVWGASELKPLAFGIKKLCILCTVVDDKVSVDDLTEKLEEFEDYIQSVDIAAFNKV